MMYWNLFDFIKWLIILNNILYVSYLINSNAARIYGT